MTLEQTEQNVKNLDDAAMTLIETAGIRVHHPELLEMVSDQGIRVSGRKVFFTKAQLTKWLSHAPDTFTLYARNPRWNAVIGGDHIEHASSNAGFPYIADPKGIRRPARFKDYLTFLKLVHTTPHFKINGGVMVTPGDLENDDTLFPTLLYATLLHSDKCLFGGMGGRAESDMTMEMLKAVFDTDTRGLIDKPRIINLVSTLSPLQFDQKMLDTLMVYAAHGQPVIISPAVMAGSTGPVTLAGAIAVSHAESLVGCALAQIVRKGTPVIYGSATSNADMRTGAFTIGTPESALAVKYCARLARSYHLPSRGGGTLNDAKNLSIQAGYESMMIQMAANLEGINFNFHSAGSLDCYGAMSFEKYVVDLDILERIRYFLKGLDTGPDHLALETILAVGPGGEYLTQKHTAVHCRTSPFMSDISLKGTLKTGISPDKVLLDNITKKIQAMLDRYQPPQLDTAARLRLDACAGFLGINTADIRQPE
ncbi:MAG: trimethylamine methyltransferase family protein [Desulfotignum sp.]|nr:trimethylamine methyltransferase family protein [Desulfotignum sp.]MCF8112951.1 trimethylamine methyltransferase family protein [Desulfotignum sp.]MCF8125354.1 trimethylamine methyltransferase family protein [Desulfotignum sp.]